jgi:hypothetical protein
VQPTTLANLTAKPRAEGYRTDLTAPLAAAAEEARTRTVAGLCLLGDGFVKGSDFWILHFAWRKDYRVHHARRKPGSA